MTRVVTKGELGEFYAEAEGADGEAAAVFVTQI